MRQKLLTSLLFEIVASVISYNHRNLLIKNFFHFFTFVFISKAKVVINWYMSIVKWFSMERKGRWIFLKREM